MKPSKIRYKGYEWLHNPEKLEVVNEDNIGEQKLFYGNSLAVKNSSKCRRIKGRGKLAGYDCLRQFNELLKLQSDAESGVLTLPEQKPFYAYFKKLELLCEPAPEVITYSFEFLEDSEKNYTVEEKYYHIVGVGETLWDISYLYSIPIEKLVSLNPEIKRVDELRVRSQVRVC